MTTEAIRRGGGSSAVGNLGDGPVSVRSVLACPAQRVRIPENSLRGTLSSRPIRGQIGRAARGFELIAGHELPGANGNSHSFSLDKSTGGLKVDNP